MDREYKRVVQEAVTEVVALCRLHGWRDVVSVATVFTAHVG